jgi:hypothetical protein
LPATIAAWEEPTVAREGPEMKMRYVWSILVVFLVTMGFFVLPFLLFLLSGGFPIGGSGPD